MFLSLLMNVILFLTHAHFSIAHPMTAAELSGENLPWHITNLTIMAYPTNSTLMNRTSLITFLVTDTNPGLNFSSICTQTALSNQTLFQDGYTRCSFKNAGFSLRADGTLWFQRIYETDPSDAIICNGNWNYNQAKYYSNDAKGLVVVEPSVDIACTLMSG